MSPAATSTGDVQKPRNKRLRRANTAKVPSSSQNGTPNESLPDVWAGLAQRRDRNREHYVGQPAACGQPDQHTSESIPSALSRAQCQQEERETHRKITQSANMPEVERVQPDRQRTDERCRCAGRTQKLVQGYDPCGRDQREPRMDPDLASRAPGEEVEEVKKGLPWRARQRVAMLLYQVRDHVEGIAGVAVSAR